MCMKFTTFWKTRKVSQSNYCRYYYIRKRCLVKRLKGLTSAHISVISVLMGSKHCWSQRDTTIFLFFHNFEINWIGKSLPASHLRSSDCLLTRWLPMRSIPVAICRFSGNKFKRFYLKKERPFEDFLYYFWNVHEIENILKKKTRVSYRNYYRNYCIRKRCLLKRLKGLASADHSIINVLMGSKHCWSQHGTTIFLFFHPFEKNWVWKCLP